MYEKAKLMEKIVYVKKLFSSDMGGLVMALEGYESNCKHLDQRLLPTIYQFCEQLYPYSYKRSHGVNDIFEGWLVALSDVDNIG